MSDPELRASFDEHAELYDRIRPTYPSEFVSQPRRLTDLGPGCRVAEIGRAPARLDEATRARKGCGRSGPGRRTGHRHDVSRFQRQPGLLQPGTGLLPEIARLHRGTHRRGLRREHLQALPLRAPRRATGCGLTNLGQFGDRPVHNGTRSGNPRSQSLSPRRAWSRHARSRKGHRS